MSHPEAGPISRGSNSLWDSFEVEILVPDHRVGDASPEEVAAWNAYVATIKERVQDALNSHSDHSPHLDPCPKPSHGIRMRIDGYG